MEFSSPGVQDSPRSYSDRQRALKWVLPTTLRVYGLRPSGKTKGSTASFLKASLPTDCVLAALRQDARSALRSGKMQGVRFAQPVGKVVLALIPTGNGLRPSFAQPVGKVVLANHK